MKRVLAVLVAFVVLATSAGIGLRSTQATVHAAGTAAVTIPGDRFVPFVQTVNVGDTVTWSNTDTDLHTVVSVPGFAPDPLNLVVKAGSTASFTFSKPGLYWYYCDMHATFDATTNQVKANANADNPAAPQEGVIYVQGATTAPSTATVTSPGDRFTPFGVTIAAGGTVTFQNPDTDLHTVVNVPGFAPAPINLTLKSGASVPMTFTTPGLYWYYCDVHATWDAANGQVDAMATADAPSEPMMGVVAVMAPPAQATPTATATATAPATATVAPTVVPAPPKTGDSPVAPARGTSLSIWLLIAAASVMVGVGGTVLVTNNRGHRS